MGAEEASLEAPEVSSAEASAVVAEDIPDAPAAVLEEAPPCPEDAEAAPAETEAVGAEPRPEATGETTEEATSGVPSAAPEEAAALDRDEGTAENESSGERAELEENSPVESESSAGEASQEEACASSEAASAQG